MSAGQAIESLIVGEVEAFGSNYIEVEIKTPQTDQASTENAFSMVGGTGNHRGYGGNFDRTIFHHLS